MLKLILMLVLRLSYAETEKITDSYFDQFGTDIKSPWVNTESRNVVIGGSALTLALLIGEDQIVDPAQEEVTDHKPLGKYSKYGDMAGQVYPNLAYVLGMWSYSYFSPESQAANHAVLMLKSTFYAGLVSTSLKAIVREPRPYDSNVKTSFPSGHTTTAFAFAGTVASLHEWYWGLAGYTMASAVAFSRMNDNKHYIHDVVAGATIGLSYGLALSNHTMKKDEMVNQVILLPTEDGLLAKYIFNY